VPTLLTLPSAATAARAFQTLTESARKHLQALTTLSGSAFFLAYLLSPGPYRHPYLLYTSVLVFASKVAASEALAPYLLTQSFASPTATSNTAAARKRRTTRGPAPHSRMEASYEVLPSGSDVHSDGTGGSASGEEHEGDDDAQAENINGEEVRANVEGFLKKQVARALVAGTAFLISIVGIWGDGVTQVQRSTVVIEI
jgi:autophagy-related protein 33